MKEELNVDSEKTLDVMNHSVARIMHLRRLLLVHSYLYYVLDDPVVPDDVWQSWADELTELQKLPYVDQGVGFYDEAFRGWDGSTGYHLPFEDKWVVSKALQIRRLTRVADCIDRGDE